MKIIVAYDISDNGVRESIARFLMRKGLARIQRSLFVGRGSGQVVKDIIRYCEKLIDTNTDCVHIFILNDYEYLQARVIGKPWGESREIVSSIEII